MRVKNLGATFTVAASRADVAAFAARWPCFGAVNRVVFEFDRRNGDLVDIIGEEGMDESGLLALSQDCQDYGITHFERKAGSTWV